MLREDEIQIGETYWGADTRGRVSTRTVLRKRKEYVGTHEGTVWGDIRFYETRIYYEDSKGTRRECNAGRFCSFWRSDSWVKKKLKDQSAHLKTIATCTMTDLEKLQAENKFLHEKIAILKEKNEYLENQLKTERSGYY
ncbi:MAG: hypothetical protein GY737_20675 [Desulfobacteraceae bacterium]|nr:hypothetical protein [Desulfobacteraceae bacterium]